MILKSFYINSAFAGWNYKKLALTELTAKASFTLHRTYRTDTELLYSVPGRNQLWHRAVNDGKGNYHGIIPGVFLHLRQQNL